MCIYIYIIMKVYKLSTTKVTSFSTIKNYFLNFFLNIFNIIKVIYEINIIIILLFITKL